MCWLDVFWLVMLVTGFNWFQLVSACGFAILICQFGAKFTCDEFVIVLCTEVPCGFSFQISNVIFRYCDAWFDKLMWFSWHEPGKQYDVATVFACACVCFSLLLLTCRGFSCHCTLVGLVFRIWKAHDLTWHGLTCEDDVLTCRSCLPEVKHLHNDDWISNLVWHPCVCTWMIDWYFFSLSLSVLFFLFFACFCLSHVSVCLYLSLSVFICLYLFFCLFLS